MLLILRYIIYIPRAPMTSIFAGQPPQNKAFFQSKQGSSKGSRKVYHHPKSFAPCSYNSAAMLTYTCQPQFFRVHLKASSCENSGDESYFSGIQMIHNFTPDDSEIERCLKNRYYYILQYYIVEF